MADLSRLEADLNRLASLPVTGENTAELLQQAVTATTELPEVSGAGLMLLDAEQALRYVTASDEPGRTLERGQEQAGEGPCIEALVRDQAVGTADLRADPRWPRLASLVASSPIRAVLGTPTHLGAGAVGTLNVYADHPHEWDSTEISALGAFARVIDRLLISSVARQRSDQLAQQLQYALDYRAVIERAVGYLMCHEQVDDVTAFTRLRSAARSQRRKIGDLAREVLDGQPLPTPTAPRRRRQLPAGRSTAPVRPPRRRPGLAGCQTRPTRASPPRVVTPPGRRNGQGPGIPEPRCQGRPRRLPLAAAAASSTLKSGRSAVRPRRTLKSGRSAVRPRPCPPRSDDRPGF